MYLYVVLLVCALGLTQTQAGTLTGDEEKAIMKYGIECITESGCDPELLKGTIDGEFPDKTEFKEYLWCFHKKTQMQDDSGKINKDVIIPFIERLVEDKAKVKEIIDKCLVEKDSPQNTARWMATCMFPYVPKDGIDRLKVKASG